MNNVFKRFDQILLNKIYSLLLNFNFNKFF